jgi:hypothetical protein
MSCPSSSWKANGVNKQQNFVFPSRTFGITEHTEFRRIYYFFFRRNSVVSVTFGGNIFFLVGLSPECAGIR